MLSINLDIPALINHTQLFWKNVFNLVEVSMKYKMLAKEWICIFNPITYEVHFIMKFMAVTNLFIAFFPTGGTRCSSGRCSARSVTWGYAALWTGRNSSILGEPQWAAVSWAVSLWRDSWCLGTPPSWESHSELLSPRQCPWFLRVPSNSCSVIYEYLSYF